jgi:ribosomal protein S12 methylthiotransferase
MKRRRTIEWRKLIMPTVGFISLGCAKNQVNTEQMICLLSEAGYDISPEADQVDVAVVNTCGFIDSAKSEAIANILTLAQLKLEGRVGKIIVTGCLSERYREEILQEMPEVDGILGTGSYYDIVDVVQEVLGGGRAERFADIDAPLPEVGRVLTTPQWFAYLKIAEGCDNHCSYCVIPSLRGRYRSRTQEDVLAEARALAESGVCELIVVAQDTSRYGLDLYGERRLPQLLRELCAIEKVHWVRVHYLYPDEITDELIDVIASEPKIVKYLDIPIQHVNDEILRKMNRRGNHAYLDAMFTKLRDRIPGLVLRTSLITGLPGEGEAEFDELCEFLKKHQLERVGCFAFSPEEGTPAAAMEFPDSEIAERRAEIITESQSRLMDRWNEAHIGTVMEVLCEGYDDEAELFFGRTYADSPDIDGRVLFSAEEGCPGLFYQVEITDTVDGELVGTALEEA